MALTALTLLIGPQAETMLDTALRDGGASLDRLRLADVRVHPSGAVRARYIADVRRPDGSRTCESLVAATGDHTPAEVITVVGEHHGERVNVGIWRFAQDPALPALRVVEDPARLADCLSAHGVALAGRPSIGVRAYRPAQRAVLEVGDGRSRWFAKVVKPAAAAELRIRHDLLAERLPVPPVIAETSDGLVLLPEVPGTLLRERLISDGQPGPTGLPAPVELEHLLDALPEDLMRLPPQRSILQRVPDSAEVLRICAESDPSVPAQLAAELAARAARIVERVLTASPEPAARVPVHGDFYHDQLLTSGSRLTGLLDVDTAGPGERVDEWATLIGYLSVLGMSHAPARRYGDALLAFAQHRFDPRDLHRRTAAVVLGLVTGPFRVRLADWPSHTAARLALANAFLEKMRGRSSSTPGILTPARNPGREGRAIDPAAPQEKE